MRHTKVYRKILNEEVFFFLILIEIVWMILLLTVFSNKLNQLIPNQLTPDTYYLPAVIISIDDKTTTFEEAEGTRQYQTETLKTFDMNTEYLLTMDTHGTVTKTDDSIIVVWKDTN